MDFQLVSPARAPTWEGHPPPSELGSYGALVLIVCRMNQLMAMAKMRSK
jgi:hypothetical protein